MSSIGHTRRGLTIHLTLITIDQKMINTSTQSINSIKTITPNGQPITIPTPDGSPTLTELGEILGNPMNNLDSRANPNPFPSSDGITRANDFMVAKRTAESQAILNVLYTERQKLVDQVLQNQSVPIPPVNKVAEDKYVPTRELPAMWSDMIKDIPLD